MKIFLATHGKMASGMKSTLDILLGDSSKLQVFDAYLDDENPKEIIKSFINTVDSDEVLILLSDIYGGSINQMLFNYIDRPNTYLVSGINLGFLLELMLKDFVDSDELDALVLSSRSALKRVVKDNSKEDETFFK